MSLKISHKDVELSVGDTIRVIQKIKEGDKNRLQAFEGILISIKGRNENSMITVRRIGETQIGIERIFPLASPTIEKVEVKRKGGRGAKRAKLYYIRNKPRKEVEKIYSRAAKKEKSKKTSKVSKSSKNTKKKK